MTRPVVQVRVPPMLVLADSQPYYGDHLEGASTHLCCYYYCLIQPLYVVYDAFLDGYSL